ncbi:MAG: hydratase [Acuticoccus sp.]
MSEDAATLAAAFRGEGPVRSLANTPRTVAEGYALQAAVREALGRPVVGFKVAHAAKQAQRAAGIDAPTVAPLLDGMIVPGETVFPARAFYAPIVEAEIVVELDRPLEGPRRKDEIIAALRGCRLGIEVADTRYVDKDAMGTAAQIGDMNGGAALVIGPLLALDTLHELMTAAPSARLGDGTVAPAVPPEGRPSPIEMIAFLLEFLAERGEGLPAGAIVTTGTHTVPMVSAPGQITVRFGDTMRLGARLSEPWSA